MDGQQRKDFHSPQSLGRVPFTNFLGAFCQATPTPISPCSERCRTVSLSATSCLQARQELRRRIVCKLHGDAQEPYEVKAGNGCGSTPIPFWGRCTTRFSLFVWGLGCSLGVRDFDPWPYTIVLHKVCVCVCVCVCLCDSMYG